MDGAKLPSCPQARAEGGLCYSWPLLGGKPYKEEQGYWVVLSSAVTQAQCHGSPGCALLAVGSLGLELAVPRVLALLAEETSGLGAPVPQGSHQ